MPYLLHINFTFSQAVHCLSTLLLTVAGVVWPLRASHRLGGFFLSRSHRLDTPP